MAGFPAMSPRFNAQKATESVAVLLKMGGGTLHHIHAMKLLYIAERRALQRWGRSITWDKFVSMDNGPVLSQTLNLINGSVPNSQIWDSSISDRADHQISLVNPEEFAPQALSRAEIKILEESWNEFGHIDRFKLCEMTHDFPEWQDPHGSSIPINFRSVLEDAHWTPEEITQIESEHAQIFASQQIF